MSLKKSNTVDHHYVFTEDDEIAQTVLETGWKVIPRSEEFLRYDDKRFDEQRAWEEITRYICRDLDIDLPTFSGKWSNAFNLLSDISFHLNCNNCMLKSKSFKEMFDRITTERLPAVYPATRTNRNLMVAHENGYLFPVWLCQGLNRQFYPPLFEVLLNTGFKNKRATITGRPTYYFHEVDPVEAIDVHDMDDINFIEWYLETHPDHFAFDIPSTPA
jgi:hypothetical protein